MDISVGTREIVMPHAAVSTAIPGLIRSRSVDIGTNPRSQYPSIVSSWSSDHKDYFENWMIREEKKVGIDMRLPCQHANSARSEKSFFKSFFLHFANHLFIILSSFPELSIRIGVLAYFIIHVPRLSSPSEVLPCCVHVVPGSH